MANDVADLLLRIDATTEGLRRELKRAEDAVQGGTTAIDKNTKQIDKSFNSMGKNVSAAIGTIVRAAAALGVALSVREVVQYADAWQNATNQLKTVQKETESLAATQSLLMEAANDTRVGYETTANLYTRLSRATESLNLTQSELIALTSTINKSFAVSGATATEASNAIVQLSQGLAAGALRGEEFNSIAEQSPILLDAIGKSLNMTRGELRAYASEGGITSEVIVNALRGSADEIDGTFRKMTSTFSQNAQIAKNNALEFVGSADSVGKAVGLAGGALVIVSNNLDTFANVIASASVALGTFATVQLVRFVAQMNLAAAAQGLFNAAVLANPYVIAAAAVGALTFAVLEYTKESREAAKQTRELVDDTMKLVAAMDLNGIETLSLEERMRQLVLTSAATTAATNNATVAVVQSTRRTAEEIAELGKKAVALDHGTRSTGALLAANAQMIDSLSVVRMSYSDNIAMMNKSTWTMQGVTTATSDAAKANEFWTAVSKEGAERRSEAERLSAEAARLNWERTHEYLTTTFIDIFNNGKNAFDNIAKAFSAMIQRMVAEWAASKLMNLIGIGGGSGSTATGTIGNILGASAGGGGSAASSIASSIAPSLIGGSGGTLLAAGGQFLAGASGTAIGAGSALAGPPTAAAAAGSGIAAGIGGAVKAVGSAISGGASAATAFVMANPLLAAAAVAAAAAAALAKKPTYSSNAGLLIHDAPGASADRKFAVDPFESGFSPIGFARREDQSAANEVINVFRKYDASLTEIARAAGLTVDFSNNPFGGYNEKGQGNGLFLGTASEEKKGVTSAPITDQLTQFTKQWVEALGAQLSAQDRSYLLASASADELMQRAATLGQAEMGRLDGSHAAGLSYVPFDGYRAELHAGERVLTAPQARSQDAMQGEMQGMMMQMREMVRYAKKTSDLLTRVTRDGDSLVTVPA